MDTHRESMPRPVARAIFRDPLHCAALAPCGLLALCVALALCAGCEQAVPDLDLDSLNAGERLYFERVVAVERSRSVALVDRERGNALLDSLAAAWGDSIVPDVLAGLAGDPVRSEALHTLLARVVAAEHDSLLWAPGADRLALPLPDPDRPGRERNPAPAAVPPPPKLDAPDDL